MYKITAYGKLRSFTGANFVPQVTTTSSITFNWLTDRNNCRPLKATTACTYLYTGGQGYKSQESPSTTQNFFPGNKIDPRIIRMTVHYLAPYTTYVCNCSITNNAGTSNSEPIIVTTDENGTLAIKIL